MMKSLQDITKAFDSLKSTVREGVQKSIDRSHLLELKKYRTQLEKYLREKKVELKKLEKKALSSDLLKHLQSIEKEWSAVTRKFESFLEGNKKKGVRKKASPKNSIKVRKPRAARKKTTPQS